MKYVYGGRREEDDDSFTDVLFITSESAQKFSKNRWFEKIPVFKNEDEYIEFNFNEKLFNAKDILLRNGFSEEDLDKILK
jgi:hypothetical protein